MAENMKVLVFRIKLPIISYKSPISYQAKTSNILIPPSALLGALYKNYVKIAGLDYNENTLESFLDRVKYVGVTLFSNSSPRRVGISTSGILLKTHRVERDGKGVRADAMVREFVNIGGEVVGLLAVDTTDTIFARDLEESLNSIEYLGNSESLVSVRVVETLEASRSPSGDSSKLLMLQIVGSDAGLFPSIGVIEQCGKLPQQPWGGREPGDICYVWNPLRHVRAGVYDVVVYEDVREELRRNGYTDVYFVYSKTLGVGMAFTTNGFDCLTPRQKRARK